MTPRRLWRRLALGARSASWRTRLSAATAAAAVLVGAGAFGYATLDEGTPGPSAATAGVAGIAESGSVTEAAAARGAGRDARKAAKKRVKRKRRHRTTDTRRGGVREQTTGSRRTAAHGVPRGRAPKAPKARPAATGAVLVGIDYQDAAATSSFLGQYNVDAQAADAGAQAKAVAAWINAHGGVGGRTLELRLRSFDFYRDRLSVTDQAECDELAKAGAVAVVDTHASTDIFIPCLAKKGIAAFVATTASPALADFAKHPATLFAPGSAAIDRSQSSYVRGLHDAEFFGKNERIGLLLASHLPQLDRAAEALRAALRDAKVTVAAESTVSLEDPAAFFATESNALLKMRSERVTRIVVLDDSGLVVGQFARIADAQGYRPIYGLSSVSAPQFVAQNIPARQLRSALAVGWSPLLDVPEAGDPGGGELRGQCAGIYRDAGVAVGGRTPFGQFQAMHVCESLLLLRTGLSRGGALGAAVEATTGWRSPLTLATSLGIGRHDGAAAWRLMRFDDACRCFRYDGAVRPL